MIVAWIQVATVDVSAMTESRCIVQTEQPGVADRLPVWCGRKGSSYRESGIFGLGSGRKELLPRRSTETHPQMLSVSSALSCGSSPSDPSRDFYDHLASLFLSLRVFSQLLVLWILYFGLCEHTSCRYWLPRGRQGLYCFSTMDVLVKSGVA